jgi:hypothetical protein
LSFEKELTKRRIVEAIEEIEGDVQGCRRSPDGVDLVERKLRELRLALESKPLVGEAGA